MTKSRGGNESAVQILVLVQPGKGKSPLVGVRSFKAPDKYTPKKLLNEVLQAAGMAVEAINSEHFS